MLEGRQKNVQRSISAATPQMVKQWVKDFADVDILNARVCAPAQIRQVSLAVEGGFILITSNSSNRMSFYDPNGKRWNSAFRYSIEEGIAEVLVKGCVPILNVYVEATLEWKQNYTSENAIAVGYKITPPDDSVAPHIVSVLTGTQGRVLQNSISAALSTKSSLHVLAQEIIVEAPPMAQRFRDFRLPESRSTETTTSKQLRSVVTSTTHWRAEDSYTLALAPWFAVAASLVLSFDGLSQL